MQKTKTNELFFVNSLLTHNKNEQVANALHFLHNLRPPLIHRDIKPENIFLKKSLLSLESEEKGLSEPIAKVGDFGLSVVLSGIEELKTTSKGKMGKINPSYAAPEILQGSIYTCSSDVYALGIVLWSARYRKLPFQEVFFLFLFLLFVFKLNFLENKNQSIDRRRTFSP